MTDSLKTMCYYSFFNSQPPDTGTDIYITIII